MLLPVLLFAQLVAGCGRHDAEREFVVTGIVQSPASEGQIVIAHDDIPGFMPAMTMPFFADETAVKNLQSGDRVRFRFLVGESSSRATHFELLSRVSPEATAPRLGETPRVARLKPGDPVPGFALTDQDGRPVSAGQLHEKLTVLTFIFTRCPVPDFCPLLTSRFAELQAAVGHDPLLSGTMQLWSITIDPEHDTPDVLRAYGSAHGADPARWRFLTGAPEELARLRQAFALHAVPANGGFDHSLTTALIGREGNVAAIWRGNGWKTAEIVAAARSEAQ
jgi:protein SCO1/2